jgi:hypothetical protein
MLLWQSRRSGNIRARQHAKGFSMDLEGETTRTLRKLIAAAASDQSAESTLRRVMRLWADKLPTDYLAQVGQILLQSHLDEQRENAQLN